MDYIKTILNLIGSDFTVAYIKDEGMGDFAVPCFIAAKERGINPQALASELAAKANLKDSPFEKAEAVNGYLNFFLKKNEFAKDVFERALKNGSNFFVPTNCKKQTIGIDFSSVNLAKHFHIGHLRNTITGQTLANLCEACGHKVLRLNYLGDYGTPFGEILAAADKTDTDIFKCDVSGLQAIYAQSKVFAAESDEFKELGRKYFKDIVDGEKQARAKYDYIKTTTLKETQAIFDEFNIKFDSFNGEFYYSAFVPDAIKRLENKNLLTNSQGARVINLEEFGLGIAVVISRDGYSLYLTRDIGAAIEREREYGLDKLIYITGSEQAFNFKQLFKILELMGEPVATKARHIPHGRYSLDSGRISSRDGAKALLKDIVAEAKARALAVLKERSKSDESNQAELAGKIGKAALIFSTLNVAVSKDSVFNIDRALLFEGETGPYLQYTYARLCSIFERAGRHRREIGVQFTAEEFEIAKVLSRFAETLATAAADLEPSCFTKMLLDLAKAFNKFYNEKRILGVPEQDARLLVCECVKNALEFGLKLIGIDPIEKM